MSEARYPSFLVRDLPPALRLALELDAEADGLPIQQVIREILCAHYSLDCQPIFGMIRKDTWNGARTLRVKMQFELFEALKADAAETGESMQALVQEALAAHYPQEAVA